MMDVAARRFISCREAAELYGLHPKSIQALCRQQRIPHTRIPSIRGGRGQIRVDRVAFDQQLEAQAAPVIEAPSLDRRLRHR